MLDWDALMPADRAPAYGEGGTKCPTVSQQKQPVSHPEWDRLKPVMTRDADEFVASVPLVPLKKQGRGKQEEKPAGVAAQPQDFCAGIDGQDKGVYPVHPAAVLLVMAWTSLKQVSNEERAALLLSLDALPPAEQIRHWHGACLADGLKPWQVLHISASLSGADCTKCRNLCTRYEAIGNGRAQYHWACGLGYLILETGRATERIWVAPPECNSFERWYPSDWR